MIEIHIPLPPSANTMWRNVKGRTLLSKKYREWRTEAASQIVFYQAPRKILGPVSIFIKARRPRRNADIDNRIKPILDLLEEVGVIENDNQVEFLCIRWDDVNGAVVHVKPMEQAE